MRIYLFLVIFSAGLQAVSAQPSRRQILPSETGSSIQNVHGTHLVSAPSEKSRKGKLFISLAGTGAGPAYLGSIDSVASSLGFHTMSLDYMNNVNTVVCRPSTDSTCFNSFRQEIMFGTPVSDMVQVDSVNSIYHRVVSLLRYLTSTYPSEGWQTFFSNNQIKWNLVTVAGHSQGAGHAAYLGKVFQLDRVLALAGPQDYMDTYSRPAPWTRLKGKTSPDRYFALLHKDDPYGSTKQVASNVILTHTHELIVLKSNKGHVEKGNIYLTSFPTKDQHGSVLLPYHAFVWKEILER
jgi:hypothetical protein